jgi:hypothetical protein
MAVGALIALAGALLTIWLLPSRRHTKNGVPGPALTAREK